MSKDVTYDFAGKVALVTGGASGMGYAAAEGYAKAGASVVIADAREDAVEAAGAKLRATTDDVLALTCDVAVEDEVAEMVRRSVERFGRLDMAFNNAGVQSEATDTAHVSSAEYDRVTDINLRGVWLCMKYELAQMEAQGSGAIVNCSSLGGLVGVPGRAAYHAAKHGVLGLTRSAGLEYAARAIRINAVCPGIIDTPMVAGMKEGESEAMDKLISMVPTGRLGAAGEVADAVLWLSSDAASYVVGQALAVDGGYTVQ